MQVKSSSTELGRIKNCLPGVDVDDFLKRVMGNFEILLDVLNDVFDEEKDTIERMRKALAEKNLEELRMEAHRVKGMAANISAESLRLAASELEKAVKNNEPELEPLLQKTELELAPLLASLKNLQDDSNG